MVSSSTAADFPGRATGRALRSWRQWTLRPTRAQLVSIVVLAAPVLLILLLARGLPGRLIYAGGIAAAAAVLRDGVRRHRPAVTNGWRYLQHGVELHAGYAVLWVLRGVNPQLSWLTPAAVVVDVLAHVLVLAAAISFLAARRPGRDRDGLIDAATVVVAGGLLLLQWNAPSGASLNWRTTGGLLVALLLAASLVVGLRLCLRANRPASLVFLAAGATAALSGNLARLTVGQGAVPPRWIPALWLTGAALGAYAAQLPSMRLLGERETVPDREVSAARFLVLGAALLVNPALVLLGTRAGGPPAVLLACGVCVLTLLVLWRIGRLVLEREGMRRALAEKVSEREALQVRLQHDATHDPLTGLPNRSSFLRRLEISHSSGEFRDAVLFVDLDGFKPVNDAFGHAVGDELLVAVAARLRSCLRTGDLPARLGGDEFAALVDTAQDERAAIAVAERIVAALSRPFSLSVGSVRVSASVGIAHPSPAVGTPTSADPSMRVAVPETWADASTLLNRADAAMYAAKQAGKGRYAVWPDRPGPFSEPARTVRHKRRVRGGQNVKRGIVRVPKYDFSK